jgi:L-rhamnonate dehydratase
MQITKVEAIYLRQPEVKEQCDSGQDALIIKVETDAGITGIGEVDSNPLAVKGMIEGPFSHTTAAGLGSIVVGEDPFETEWIWHKMYRANIYGGRRSVAIHAMSGIDMALWDIKGKALNMPVWKLLGGGFHKIDNLGWMEGNRPWKNGRIRCYASSLWGPTPEKTRELAGRYRQQGFTAMKFGWDPMGRDEKTDIALVREARAGMGADCDLMIDAGLCWDAKTAIQRANAFQEYSPFWLEEPLRPDDYEGYAKLSAASSLRIAAGEEESSRLSFVELMDRGKVDLIQVDLTRVGGFTEAMKIAALAWDRGLPVANHGFTTYINVTAALHWLASVPNALICEFVAEEETNLRESLTKQKIRAIDGYLPIPDAPGLGIDVDWDAVAKFRVS